MKIRNDFVSNSSSCSFIIRVENDDDIRQLTKDDVFKVLTDHQSRISGEFNTVSWGDSVESKDDIKLDHFVYVYNGEDNEFDYECSYPEDELQEIANKLNEGYGKLKLYRDDEAHVSLGEYYEDKN